MFLGIGIGISAQSGRAPWSPAGLFASGEIGFVYPMVPGLTLFQDASGTVPVTAAGQPVGLLLDVSKGLMLGPELVANGAFDTDTSGWTTASGSLTVDGQKGKLQNSGAVSATSSTPITTIAGKTYALSAVVQSVTGVDANVRVYVGTTPGGLNLLSLATNNGDKNERTLSGIFVATGTTTYVSLSNRAITEAISTFDTISVRELPGNHLTQPTALNRPIYQLDSNGLGHLAFNGTNQWMVAASFAWGSDKASLCLGERFSGAASGALLELSATVATNAGSFNLLAQETGDDYSTRSRGDAAVDVNQRATVTRGAAPDTAVLSARHDIAGDLTELWRNRVKTVNATGDKGAGNFGNHPLYIGARGGSTLFFSGNLYALTSINRLLSAAELAQLETWTAARTGVTL